MTIKTDADTVVTAKLDEIRILGSYLYTGGNLVLLTTRDYDFQTIEVKEALVKVMKDSLDAQLHHDRNLQTAKELEMFSKEEENSSKN